MRWFLLVVLTLTAYRATRLLVRDTFPPVLWLRDRLAGGWRPLTEPERQVIRQSDTHLDVPFVTTDIHGVTNRWVEKSKRSPYWLAELITCPWCASAYVSGALVLVTDLTYGLPVPWLMGGAVWAGAAVLASREWA